MASFYCDTLSTISLAPSQRAVAALLLLDLLSIVLPSSTMLSRVSSDSCLPSEQFFELHSTPVSPLPLRRIDKLRQILTPSTPSLQDATS